MGTREPPEPVLCLATGKVAHPSRKVAAENLHRVLRGLDGAGRDRKERGRMLVFKCELCPGWHIGNNDPLCAKRDKAQRRRRPPPEISESEAA